MTSSTTRPNPTGMPGTSRTGPRPRSRCTPRRPPKPRPTARNSSRCSRGSREAAHSRLAASSRRPMARSRIRATPRLRPRPRPPSTNRSAATAAATPAAITRRATEFVDEYYGGFLADNLWFVSVEAETDDAQRIVVTVFDDPANQCPKLQRDDRLVHARRRRDSGSLRTDRQRRSLLGTIISRYRAVVVDHAAIHGVLGVVVARRRVGFGCTIVAEPGHRGHRVRRGDGCDAGSRRAEHRRAEQHGVGLRGHRDRDPERVGVRSQPPRVRRRCHRTRRAGRPSRPASRERVDDVARRVRERLERREVPAARGRRRRRACGHPAVPPVSVGSASGARLPSTFGCQCRSAASRVAAAGRPRARRARRSSVGERIGRQHGRRRMRAQRVVEERARRGDAGFGAASGRAAAPPSTVPTRPARRSARVDTARWHADVPAMTASRRSSGVSSPAGAEHAERAGVRVDERDADRRARAQARARRRPRRRARRRARPGLRTSVPMRAKPSAARSSRPIAAKYDASQRRSWPRYVHLHTVLHSERSSLPVARHVRKSGEVEPVRGAAPRVGQVLLAPTAASASPSPARSSRRRTAAPDARWRRWPPRRRSRGGPSTR